MATLKHAKNPIRSFIRGVHATVVPHAGNEYHPHIIRSYGLALLMVVAFGIHVVTDMPSVGSVKGVATSDLTRPGLLEESNKVRRDNGVPSLELDRSLSSAAGLKARDMLVRQYWSHDAPDGTTPWYWYREVNYRYDFAAENLAKGYQTSGAVVTAWMNSEEHRKNALNADYQEVGFGIAEGQLNGEQTTVIVAMYGSRIGSPALGKSEVLAAEDGEMSLVGRFGVGLQSLSPTALGSIVLLLLAAVVSLLAYLLRARLPKSLKKGWRHHRALYKFIGLGVFIFLLITLYGGGEIL